jgi:hypothetical protein
MLYLDSSDHFALVFATERKEFRVNTILVDTVVLFQNGYDCVNPNFIINPLEKFRH